MTTLVSREQLHGLSFRLKWWPVRYHWQILESFSAMSSSSLACRNEVSSFSSRMRQLAKISALEIRSERRNERVNKQGMGAETSGRSIYHFWLWHVALFFHFLYLHILSVAPEARTPHPISHMYREESHSLELIGERSTSYESSRPSNILSSFSKSIYHSVKLLLSSNRNLREVRFSLCVVHMCVWF